VAPDSGFRRAEPAGAGGPCRTVAPNRHPRWNGRHLFAQFDDLAQHAGAVGALASRALGA